jgi:hypothetical protein
MTFAEALEAKNKDINAEYQMRAARIVSWLLDIGKIKKEEAENFYNRFWNVLFDSDDEFDDVALFIVDKEKGGK